MLRSLNLCSPVGTLLVRPQGVLDVTTVAGLRPSLAVAGQQATTVVVDLRDVLSMDSVTLGVLLATHREAESGGGNLVLVGASPHLLRVLRITGLVRVLDVRDAWAEAPLGAVGGDGRPRAALP